MFATATHAVALWVASLTSIRAKFFLNMALFGLVFLWFGMQELVGITDWLMVDCVALEDSAHRCR